MSFPRHASRPLVRFALVACAAASLGGCDHYAATLTESANGELTYTEPGTPGFSISGDDLNETFVQPEEVDVQWYASGEFCSFDLHLRFSRPTDPGSYSLEDLGAKACITDFEPLREGGFCNGTGGDDYAGPWGVETCIPLSGSIDVATATEDCAGDVCAYDLVADLDVTGGSEAGFSGKMHVEHDEELETESSSGGGWGLGNWEMD